MGPIQVNLRAQKLFSFFLWQVSLTEDYDILQVVGEGWFAKILLAEHRVSGTEIVLKALPKVLNSAADFYREFHYSIHLSVHRNIITSVDVAFESPGFYVFAQVNENIFKNFRILFKICLKIKFLSSKLCSQMCLIIKTKDDGLFGRSTRL